MFINDADEEDVRALVRVLSESREKYKDQKFRAFLLFVDREKSELIKLNQDEKSDNIALTQLKGKDDEAIEAYKVNPEAKSTVFVYKKRILAAKIVNFDPKKDKQKLVDAIAEVCK